MRRPRLPVVAVVAATFAALTGCTGGDDPAVQVAAVGRATVTEVVEAPATVQARATSTLTSPATGTVQKVYVRDGDRVAAGTLLVRISSPETTAQLTRARAQLAQVGSPGAPAYIPTGTGSGADTAAGTAFDTARKAAALVPDPTARATALAQIEAAAKQYAAAAAQARAAVAAINSGIGSLSAALASLTAAQRTQAETAVGIAERAVAALDVRAPIAGTVQLGGAAGDQQQGGGGSLDSVLQQLPADVRDQATAALGGGGSADTASTTGPVTAGMPVGSGTVLATVVDTSVLSLVAEVDETDVFLVKRGVRADVELDAVPGARYAATVAAVDLTPTQSARGGVAYRARLTLGAGTTGGEEPAPQPRPGMSAVADLQVRTAKDAISVPASAVVRDGGRDAVWVVSGQTVRRRPVVVGTQGEDAVAITSGLREGERIVVRGADTVRDGQELT